MVKLRKIGVVSLAKVQAIGLALVGLILGIFYSVGGFLFELATGSLNAGTALAFLALLGMPLMAGLLGLVMGALVAILYNGFASRLGPVKIEVVSE